MAIPLNSFWRSNFYKHPALTDQVLVGAERELQVKLPVEYVQLLRIQNGGYTYGFRFPMTVPTTWANDHVPLDDLNGLVADRSLGSPMNALLSPSMMKEWGLPERQVLLSGDGHWWITLDYRRGDIPSVAWIDVECGQDIPVAPTFAVFLAGLTLGGPD